MGVGSTPDIDLRLHPNGLACLEPAALNGTRQWILIRSQDRANPVVLFVHGGPGTSQLTLMRCYGQPLEPYFTVVNWDQRGAGKSFAAGRDASKMTIAQFVEDLIALSASLCQRFSQQRIVLVGHSWGSGIGMLAAARRPDLFSAYVGIGQVSNMAESERISYEWTLEQAHQAADGRSLRTLADLGPPPYTDAERRSKFITQRRILATYGGEYYRSKTGAFGIVVKNVLLGQEYTLIDKIQFFRGIYRSLDLLLAELYRLNLFDDVQTLTLPAFFCLGRHDYEVPSALSVKYFEALQAPRKQLVWFEESAHMPHTEEHEKFCRFMIDTVLPTARLG